MSIIYNINKLYGILLNIIGKRLKWNNLSFKNSTTKRIISSGASVNFTQETENKKQEINEKLKPIIKKYINSPEKLINFIKVSGIKVYRINNAEKILLKADEEEGFILPCKGIKALVLNNLISLNTEKSVNVKFSSPAMFIFDKNNVEIYTVIRALHKYYGFKNNLPGFDENSQKIYKKIYKGGNSTSLINSCSINDIFACREALARDLESINFAIEFSVENERAKKALKKIKEDNSANI